MPTRAVFFDLGGTLFSYASTRGPFDRALQEAAREHGVAAPADEVRARFREGMRRVTPGFDARPYFLHRELFRAGFLALLEHYEVAEGANGDLLYEKQVAVGARHAVPREGAAETLGALRERGLHLGIVSNIDDDQFAPVWRGVGLGAWFDATTTSEEARSCKPDPGIFRLALEKAGGLAPEEVVFVGDSPPHDVAGARPLGMTTVWITDREPRPQEGTARPHHVIRSLPELLTVVEA